MRMRTCPRVALSGRGEDADRWAAALDGADVVRLEVDDAGVPSDDVDALLVAPGTFDPFAEVKGSLLAGRAVLVAAAHLLSPWQAGVLTELSARQGCLLRFAALHEHRAPYAFLRRLLAGPEALWRPRYVRSLVATAGGGPRLDELAVAELGRCDALIAVAPRSVTASAVRGDVLGELCAAFVTVHYDDGRLLHCTVSLAEETPVRELVAVTADRTVILNDEDNAAPLRVVAGDHAECMGAGPAGGSCADERIAETRAFVAALGAGDRSVGNGTQWTRIAGLWWAARQSMSFGRAIDVPRPRPLACEREAKLLRVIEGGGQTQRAAGPRPLLTVVG